MKLHYWEGLTVDNHHIRNFGDELNPFIWGKLLGDIFDESDDVIFLGIGSLLNDNLERDLPGPSLKLIFGTGVGYGKRPLHLNNTYKVYCVRGPLSARALGLDDTYSITDSALLIRHVVPDIASEKIYKFGYMPHWTNHTARLELLCRDNNIFYIDPTRPNVMEVIKEILSCETIFAEAMHAAIIADALRVPWVSVKSTKEVIAFKWRDWCASIQVPYDPHSVMPLWEKDLNSRSFKHRLKELLVSKQLARIVNTHKPILSNAQHTDILFERLNAKMETLKIDLKL